MTIFIGCREIQAVFGKQMIIFISAQHALFAGISMATSYPKFATANQVRVRKDFGRPSSYFRTQHNLAEIKFFPTSEVSFSLFCCLPEFYFKRSSQKCVLNVTIVLRNVRICRSEFSFSTCMQMEAVDGDGIQKKSAGKRKVTVVFWCTFDANNLHV